MFEVAFKAVSILGSMPIDNNKLRRYYEQIIEAFVRSELNYLNLEKLSAIIVPDVFIDEVLEFQKEIGISNPNVTNTTLARAFEKMIHDTKEDKFYVFIDSSKAVFMMENQMFDNCFSLLKKEDYEECVAERKWAFNLLAHELSHVELESNIGFRFCTTTLREQAISLWKQVFQEYYACRRSSRIYGESSVIDHSEEYINGIENEIMKQRKNYNYNRIELNNFCQIFHKFTKMYLIHIVSELGIAKELGRTVSYGGFKIEKYLPVLEAELDRMYKTAYCENRVVVSEVLIDLLFEYYAEFRIFITETRQGVRYDIPI